MSLIQGDIIVRGSDLFWKELPEDLVRIRSCVRWATIRSNLKKRDRNIAKMKELIESLSKDIELYAPLMYPLTPQKCGFKGTVSTFEELEYWIKTNPKGVFNGENWVL